MQDNLQEQLNGLYQIAVEHLDIKTRTQFAELVGIRPDTLSKAFAGKNGCLNSKMIRNATTAVELALSQKSPKNSAPVIVSGDGNNYNGNNINNTEVIARLLEQMKTQNAEKDRQIDRLLSLLESAMQARG